MATSVQQAPVGNVTPTPDVVGNAFVHQYYLILHQSPELVHRFYQDNSKLGRAEENGDMVITTTMQAINEKILSLDYGNFSADITTVDSQDSYEGGVFVLVTGYLTGKDNLRRKFSQSFFLAPQDKGYYVLNDVFRYVEDAEHQNGNNGLVNDDEVPITPEHEPPTVLANHISEPPTAVSSEVDEEEVYNPENEEVLVEEVETPVPEVVDESPDESQMVTESISKIEEVPKTYASILKVIKGNTMPFPASAPAPAPAPLRAPIKNQEQQVIVTTIPIPASEIQSSSPNVNDNGSNQEVEADHSVYVKGLPLNATPSLVENEFKKFGPIKPNGVQVRSQKGFCFGFVEFELASSVQSAIEASPIMINGRQAVVEEKRSTNRGNSRGRFSSARGNGFRNEGARGRGSYGGGRGYGRADFSGRAEFGNRNGNRAGLGNRGGDGYQRAENGGRGNRAGGLGVNGTAKNEAASVQVSASA
ncbi:hypothetical protein UlMin_031896 [Ulmus minor]